MKLTKQASGKTTVKMSKNEWTNIGKKAGWMDDMPGSDEDFKDDFGIGGRLKDDKETIDELNPPVAPEHRYIFYTLDDKVQLVCDIFIDEKFDLSAITSVMNQAEKKLANDAPSLGRPQGIKTDIWLINPGAMDRAEKVLRITLVIEGVNGDVRPEVRAMGYNQHGSGQLV